jgi:hypothetical protein
VHAGGAGLQGITLNEQDRVSQEIKAPFCVLRSRYVRKVGSPWFLFAILLIAGVATAGAGIWDLIWMYPSHSVFVPMVLIGGFVLWLASKVLKTARRDRRYWLGIEADKLSLMYEGTLSSWPWSQISAFRVTETTTSEFVENDENQTTTILLSAPVLAGPPIEMPVDRFMSLGHQERDRAENLCTFLNDVRERGRSGRLAYDTFLAPIELNIAPMKNGVPAKPAMALARPAVQRQ